MVLNPTQPRFTDQFLYGSNGRISHVPLYEGQNTVTSDLIARVKLELVSHHILLPEDLIFSRNNYYYAVMVQFMYCILECMRSINF